MWPIVFGVFLILSLVKLEFIILILFFITIFLIVASQNKSTSDQILNFLKNINVNNIASNFNFSPKIPKFKRIKSLAFLLSSFIFCMWIGWTGFYWVKLNEEAVLMRFGAVIDHKKSGWYWKFPYPVERVIIRDVTTIHKINTSDLSRSDGQMLTKDENILTVFLTVFWRISNLNQYVFKATDPEGILKAATESIVRQVIAMHDAEECLTVSRAQIGHKIKNALSNLIDSYQIGIEIIDIQMGKIDPPDSVIDSYRDVVKAKLAKETKRNKAESHANFIIPKAKGEAISIINKAEEYKVCTLEAAKGEYESFKAKLRSYSSNPKVAKEFMIFDTMSYVFSNAKNINVVDPNVKVMLLQSGNKVNGEVK